MKKIVGLILLAVMVLIAVPAKSQIKFGIKGGLNISSVHFNKDLVGKDNVTGFNIGPMGHLFSDFFRNEKISADNSTSFCV